MRELPEVPSASGIEYIDKSFYVIGDNAPWIYVLDTSFQQISKYALGKYRKTKEGLLPKSEKHDFEAMTELSWEGKKYLFVFGSGSKEPYRFEGKMLDLEALGVVKTFSLHALYDRICEEAKLDANELNIEAAAEVDGKLYLFNRGKNKLIQMDVKQFMAFILGKKNLLKLKVYSIDLPEINGIRSGFSGAAGDSKHNRIVFTSSVENTDDWVQDGEILGSFIGVIDLENVQQHYTPETVQLIGKNKEERFKVESIALMTNERQTIECVVVTDNDGHSSELMTVSIHFQ